MNAFSLFLVCQVWCNSNWWKSSHGYLPPSVANRKPIAVMPRGRKRRSKVSKPTNRNWIQG